MILLTGGAGFIGGNFVLDWLARHDEAILNLDALTYAGNIETLETVMHDPRHVFVHGDINDRTLVDDLLDKYQPRAIVHMAAETHVDRSVKGAEIFVRSNVQGTFTLLEAARNYWDKLPAGEREAFRFLQVGTDEVYGSLGPDDPAFIEERAYEPNSPYSASKAAADHLVRAWFHTYGLPTLVTHCSNNYGPYQFPEKLIPLVISHALAGEALPIYGDGLNVRDWLYVTDHCHALEVVLENGVPGSTYNIGGWNEKDNLEIVRAICKLLDKMCPDTTGPYERLIKFVADRPGHDRRYAIDAHKIERDLGWRPGETFASGILKTVQWYIEHTRWVERTQTSAYRDWVETQYAANGS